MLCTAAAFPRHVARAPVDAADAACDKDADARSRCQQHGGADRGRAIGARCDDSWQVAARHFAHRCARRRNVLQLLAAQAWRSASCVVRSHKEVSSAALERFQTAIRAGPEGPCSERPRCTAHAPTQHWPRMMAIVAGTAPARRTTSSTSSAVCKFCGYGMPAGRAAWGGWLCRANECAPTTCAPLRSRRGGAAPARCAQRQPHGMPGHPPRAAAHHG